MSGFSPRSFASASVGGNPVGRPPTSAGSEPSRAARALIAAVRYRRKQSQRQAPDPGAAVSATAFGRGELSSLRAAAARDQADWMREGATS